MITDQRERIRRAVVKPGFLIASSGVLTVGVINLVRAWRKHDMVDAVAAVLIFFVIGPLVAWLLRKVDWTQ